MRTYIVLFFQRQPDIAGGVVFQTVFQCVTDEFIDQQTTGNGFVDVNFDVVQGRSAFQ